MKKAANDPVWSPKMFAAPSHAHHNTITIYFYDLKKRYRFCENCSNVKVVFIMKKTIEIDYDKNNNTSYIVHEAQKPV